MNENENLLQQKEDPNLTGLSLADTLFTMMKLNFFMDYL